MQSDNRVIGAARPLCALTLITLVLAVTLSSVSAGSQTVGLLLHEPGSFDGYTLFAGILQDNAYLIDNEGRLVHVWNDVCLGECVTPYLLEDGTIMNIRTGHWVRRFAWDGTLLWDYRQPFDRANGDIHHDIEVLPNGNVLILARENVTTGDAIAAGRGPALLSDELRSVHIFEVEPTGPTSGEVVWEWRAWDHLVQEFDSTKDNYGVVADHPELIDVNFVGLTHPPKPDYDWHHSNAVDYNKDFDQIVVSVRNFSEIWVIDHSTTMLEAASHGGGNSGKGGDLLYRWGNPQAYGAGDAADQQLFSQHDSQWIAPGLPGEGNILIFNNGNGRPDGEYSSVVEISPPVDSAGSYGLEPDEAFGPISHTWDYDADFYAAFFSGADRLPNGNTLINIGTVGTFLEVTPSGQIVWKYISPLTSTGPVVQGQAATDNRTFRTYRYSPDYPGLVGKDLTPMGPIELPRETEAPTGTATATVTPSSTPTPVVIRGDASDDGIVNAIDAQFILQYIAGTLDALPDPLAADVNGDGTIASTDVLLVLQFTAGLLPSLL